MIGVLAVERSYPALGSHLCGMAWDGHHLWYADAGTDRLSCLDVHTGTILQEVVCLEVRTGLTSDGTSLSQMAGHPKRIRVIDPADGHIVREIDLGEHAEGMGGLFVDGTSYWLGPEQERGLFAPLASQGSTLSSKDADPAKPNQSGIHPDQQQTSSSTSRSEEDFCGEVMSSGAAKK